MSIKFLPLKRAVRTALLVLLMSAVGLTKGFAYDFSAVCSTGQTLYYEITDAANHYVELVAPGGTSYSGWSGFTKPTGDIVLPESVQNSGVTYSVTSIAKYAFNNCDGLTGSLTIPNCVISIGNFAFGGCDGFTGNLTIPNSVTTIGEYAFYVCSGFTGDLTIPNSVNTIGNSAFELCSGFTGILTIGHSVTSIKEFAFRNLDFTEVHYNATNCANLNRDYPPFSGCGGTLVIGDNVTRIPAYIFKDAGFTGNLVFPNSVTSIGSAAFMNCNFTEVHYDFTRNYGAAGLISAPFAGCGGTLVIGQNVDTIPDGVFAESAFTGNLVIPNTVTTIGNYAFYGCYCNGNLTIGNSVTSIGEWTFFSSDFTGNLNIPNSVTTIKRFAFETCTGFTGILTIPNSVTSIGEDAFSACTGFSEVHYYAANCEDASYSSHPPFFDCGGVLTIGENVERIPNYIFAYADFTGSLTIPNSVTSIGNGAFYYCSSFTDSLTISNSVTSIGIRAFYYCSSFTGSLTIPNSVTMVGNGAFSGCSFAEVHYNATNCTDPETLDTRPFNNCGGALIIGQNVERIPNAMFAQSNFTGDLAIPNSVTSIGGSAFSGCNGFTGDLTIGTSVTSIGDWAFDGCDSINNIYSMNTTPPSISQYTFYDLYNKRLIVPCEAFESYQNADYWSNFTNILCMSPGMAVFAGGSTTNHWSDPNNWIPNELPTATTSVNIMADAEMDLDAFVQGLTVYGSNVVTIAADVQLTVAGTLESPSASSIVVEDGGQLVHTNDGVLATVKRTVTPYTDDERDGWHLITSPLASNVNASEVQNLTLGEYDLYYYDEPTVYWINNEDSDNNFNTLENGIGYLYGNKCFAPYEAQVGNEDNTTNTYFPFHTWYENGISESLFLAEELENAGLGTSSMTSLSWYATTSTGYLQSNLSIWMANVSESVLTSTSHNTSGMTLVYTGAMTPEIGWNEFVFNEDGFAWDGVSNVLICVQRNNGAWQEHPVNWQSHHCDFYGMTYSYRDDTPYDMATETYGMTTSTVRANTIFKALGGQGESITISFTGEINNGSATVNVPLSYTTGHALQGFNLVGNPFAHNVTSYASVNVANGCYVMNEAKDDLIVSEISEENPLKPAEGFFVKATAAGASITFNPGRGSTATQSGTIRVELMENDKLIDRLLVKTAEGQPLEKFSLNERRTRLFAQGERQELAIVPCEGNEQAVNFKAAKNGQYTISVNAEGMDFSYLHLIDNLTGADVDLLAEPSYTFEAKTSDYASRFLLRFIPKDGSSTSSETFAFISNGSIVITDADANATLQIVDVTGRVVVSSDAARNVSTSGMSAGVYVLRLINGNDVRIQKIVVE